MPSLGQISDRFDRVAPATMKSVPPPPDMTKALVKLLRTRSTEEIRQRMYDNPPGSSWWTACKAELEARNGEQTATAMVEMSRVLDKMRLSTERLDSMSERVTQATIEATELLKSAHEFGRKIEIATYVMVGVTVLQIFYTAFQVMGKR